VGGRDAGPPVQLRVIAAISEHADEVTFHVSSVAPCQILA
jgi:hypothetical protein